MELYFIDTNVIVSGLLWSGNENRLLLAAEEGSINAATSGYVIDETARVLRDYFGIDAARIVELLGSLRSVLREVDTAGPRELKKAGNALSDREDIAILAAALKHGCCLVTGDKRLTREAKLLIKVMSAKEVLEKENLI